MLKSLQQHVTEFASVLNNPSFEEKESFVKKIKQSPKIPAQLAIDIYRNNTRGSKVNALKAIYPVCKRILGDEAFHSIANYYIDIDVTGTSDLNKYGEEFNQHLTVIFEAGRLPADYNYLPDLARLEYRFHAAYYADDDPSFDFELLNNSVQKEEKIYFRVSDSLALLKYQTPIYEIWMNNRKVLNLGESSVPAITDFQYLLVYRENNTPVIHTITKNEYQLLDAFISGYSLQDVIDSFDYDVETMLPKLIAKRWLAGIK